MMTAIALSNNFWFQKKWFFDKNPNSEGDLK